MYIQYSFLAVLLQSVVFAQQTLYGQCGGISWTGPTSCVAGSTCTVLNPYYSQCLPGSSASSTSSRTSTTTAIITPTLPPTTTTTSPPSTVLSGGGGIAPTGVGTTLLSNYYWIRAVESPNFHSYLQTSPTDLPGPAILTSYLTAGQFQILPSGQFVEVVDTEGTLLYANVEVQANSSVTMLGVTFEAEPNSYGTFSFQGDAVTWSVPSINRPNTAAWLVCENQLLYINLGNYAYMTPEGCADETIHYYNGATAVD